MAGTLCVGFVTAIVGQRYGKQQVVVFMWLVGKHFMYVARGLMLV